jgi:hypothetical protein
LTKITNFMKKQFTLAFFVSLAFAAFSQKNICRVLSENGLKLREQPSLNGKVLAVAPFWSEVEVLAEKVFIGSGISAFSDEFKKDTFGIGYVCKRNYRFIDEIDTILNQGHWIPVNFRGKKGFMFEAFLGEKWEKYADSYPKELNENYRLRTIYGNNSYNNHPEIDPNWKWQGLFISEKGAFVKPVELRYLGSQHGILTLTKDEIQPNFIFGSKKNLAYAQN